MLEAPHATLNVSGQAGQRLNEALDIMVPKFKSIVSPRWFLP